MDPAFRQRIIDTFINSVYLYDNKVVIFFNIREGQQTCAIDALPALDELIEENPSKAGSTLKGNGGACPAKVEHDAQHAIVFVGGMLGLVVFRE